MTGTATISLALVLEDRSRWWEMVAVPLRVARGCHWKGTAIISPLPALGFEEARGEMVAVPYAFTLVQALRAAPRHPA